MTNRIVLVSGLQALILATLGAFWRALLAGPSLVLGVVGTRKADPISSMRPWIESISRAIVSYNVAVSVLSYLAKEPAVEEAAAHLSLQSNSISVSHRVGQGIGVLVRVPIYDPQRIHSRIPPRAVLIPGVDVGGKTPSSLTCWCQRLV